MQTLQDYDDPTCPECGAPQVEGMNCWWQLGGLIAWEAHDPALAARHFYVVATFNLQHPAQFTPEALAGLAALFRDAVDGDLANEAVLRLARARGAGEGKVLRPAAEREPELRRWPVTIADVYLPGQPAGAAGRVMAWAAAVRHAFVR